MSLQVSSRPGLVHYYAWLLLLFAASNAPLVAQQAQTNSKSAQYKTAQDLKGALDQVDSLFRDEFAKYKFVGMTIGVVSGPQLVWTKSYGLADVTTHAAVSQNSTYRVGSITKQFTAIMLLQLVQQGKVHLSDSIEKYYPEFHEIPNPFPGAVPVTLLQLATHTAGLAREPDDTAAYTTGSIKDWEEILHSALPHVRFQYEPGTRFNYSNIGYAILGAALGRAAGKPYTRYVEDHILKPLGMNHTGFEPSGTLAKGYVLSDTGPDPSAPASELRSGRGYKVPNGALFSSVPDMARFVELEMGDGPDQVLIRSLITDSLSRVYTAKSDLSFGYGIGFAAYNDKDVLTLGHDGSVAGYEAQAYFSPASHIGVICLTNTTIPTDITLKDTILSALKLLAED